MRSWDNAKGREGDTSLSLPKKKTCPYSVWFGDYSLKYCGIDNAICENETKCRHSNRELCNITTKEKE
jgi:hypothetical protein